MIKEVDITQYQHYTFMVVPFSDPKQKISFISEMQKMCDVLVSLSYVSVNGGISCGIAVPEKYDLLVMLKFDGVRKLTCLPQSSKYFLYQALDTEKDS